MTDNLSQWNTVAAALHGALALWAIFKLPSKDVTLYKVKYEVDATPASDLDYAMSLETANSQNIKTLVIAFFAITSIIHILYATDFLGRKYYTNAVRGYGWNPFRWIEYSITASIMIYLIAIVAGTKEVSNTLVATLLTPGLMLQGLTVERELNQNALAAWANMQSDKRPNVDPVLVWFNFLPAWFFFALKWYIIWNSYVTLRKQLQDEGKTIDSRITELVWIQFIGFTTFGVIQSVQVYSWLNKSRGNWSQTSYVNYEKAYIALSFIVKAALGLSVARLLN